MADLVVGKKQLEDAMIAGIGYVDDNVSGVFRVVFVDGNVRPIGSARWVSSRYRLTTRLLR
jgi:hypothetical protein